MNPYTEAVQRGAALLDEHNSTWVDEIDLSTLDLSNPRACVLGQIYQRFDLGEDALRLGHCFQCSGRLRLSTEHGFDIPWDDVAVCKDEAYAWLTHVWRELILARRAAAEVAA